MERSTDAARICGVHLIESPRVAGRTRVPACSRGACYTSIPPFKWRERERAVLFHFRFLHVYVLSWEEDEMNLFSFSIDDDET